jgi:hypothetical protein
MKKKQSQNRTMKYQDKFLYSFENGSFVAEARLFRLFTETGETVFEGQGRLSFFRGPIPYGRQQASSSPYETEKSREIRLRCAEKHLGEKCEWLPGPLLSVVRELRKQGK